MLNRCHSLRRYLMVVLAMVWISGCHDDTTAPSNTPAAPAAAGQSLSIKGVPQTSALAGRMYSFTPTVSSSNLVTFSIVGQPAWARFNTATGLLSGIPGVKDEGTTGKIIISAANDSGSTSMAPFAIAVKAGSASLSWTPPTQNTDGSPVAGLAGYYVSYGTSPDELTRTITVAGGASATCIITGLAVGTYYFTVVAYTKAGTKSGESNVASQTI
jgi:Fibronectin type III domain